MRLDLTAVACLFVLSTSPVTGQQATVESEPAPDTETQGSTSDSAQIEEILRRIDLLAAELEQLRSGESSEVELSAERRRSLGLAPSAAATYRRTEGVSFAGYGEMLLQNFDALNESGVGQAPITRLDFLRHILYTGYRFNDKFLFNSELEVEHGKEIYVEFAYVDYLANDNLTLRGGMVLLPLGLVNEFHEPTVFLGATRPQTEQRIIPSTWRENGAGILGSAGPLSFRAYLTNGLNGAGFSSKGLRGGRQKGAKALAANMAFSGRLDFAPAPGIVTGVGLYSGGSGQEQVVVDGEALAMATTVVEVHGLAQWRGFDLRVLFAQASVDKAGEASRALKLKNGAPIANLMRGGYLQVGYDILSQLNTPLAVTPYLRYEQVDTQHQVPAGFVRDLSRDGVFTTLGIEFKPIPNVAIKTDYQWITNATGTGRNQLNMNLGYAF